MLVCRALVRRDHALALGTAPADGKPFLPRTRVMLHTDDGRDLVAFPKRDGTFVLHDVPAGTHLLDVDCMGLIFPQVWRPHTLRPHLLGSGTVALHRLAGAAGTRWSAAGPA